MPTDEITILRNPEQKYWEDIVKEAVINNGWINSFHDYETFKNAFPNDKFILLVAVDSESQFIGSVCVATYENPEPLSAIGMYLVKDEYRGKGVGSRLFDAAIELCAPKKFLYGVQNMKDKYRDKYGFNKIPDWHLQCITMEVRKVKPLQLNHDPTLTIKKPTEVGWDAISKYYQKFSPKVEASALIKALLEEKECHNAVALTAENRIVGLVRLRETHNKGLAIGPWLGNDGIAACTVLRHVLCRLETLREFKSISLNCPNTNLEVHDFLRQLTDGEYKLGSMVTYPQFTDEILELPINYIYAISQNDIAIV